MRMTRMRTKILVYLDSSDYSVLSDSKRRSDEIDQILTRLLSYAKSEHVVFVYSAAAICEMAPQDPQWAGYAEGRANLLSTLCQRNAFISFDRLIAGEAEQIKNLEIPEFSPFSENGDWFPEMTGFVSPVDLVATFKSEMEKQKVGHNRKQRRAAQSRTFRNGHLRMEAGNSLQRDANDLGFKKLLAAYPMNPETADVMWGFVAGIKSRKEAEDAFLENLRDPKWMMKWFYNHHDRLSPIVTWLRSPSEKAASALRTSVARFRELSRAYDPSALARTISNGRIDLIEKVWANIVERTIDTKLQPKATQIEERSPGLNAMLNTYYSVFADSALTTRELKESDFADVVHATYSPYVDIFRTDRYMAPHVQSVVQQYGTTVVSRLTDLPNQIEAAIARISV